MDRVNFRSVWKNLEFSKKMATTTKAKKMKIQVHVYSSSHGRRRHNLPLAFENLLEDSTRFEMPIFHAKSGRKIDQSEIQEIKTQILSKTVPCANIVLLGSNNLRRNEKWEDIKPFFDELLAASKGTKRSHLVFAGIVPSPATDLRTKEKFQIASSGLLDLASEHTPRVSFFPTANSVTKNGKIDNSCFDDDGIHLSIKGARKVAIDLAAHLNNRPKAAFN